MIWLGEFEQLVMLALMRLQGEGYGVSVLQEIHQRTGREVSLGSVYKTLQRLEDKGLVRSRVGDPTAERGGRRKKHFAAEPSGVEALNRSLRSLRSLSVGLEPEAEA